MYEVLKEYIMVFLVSMTPVAELRAALPMGIAMDLNVIPTLITCVAGNMVPAPFIILCIRQILKWMGKKGGILRKIQRFIKRKAKKGAKMFYKYELLGLFILVAIPLPGTGAWTGSLVAAMLGIRMKVAIPVIAAGVSAAGVIVSLITCGVESIFSGLL